MDITEILFLCQQYKIKISFEYVFAFSGPCLSITISKLPLYRRRMLTEYEYCYMSEVIQKDIDELLKSYNEQFPQGIACYEKYMGGKI